MAEPISTAAIATQFGLKAVEAIGGGPGPTTSAASPLNHISVAPIGVNLGEILRGPLEGSPENGGVAADYLSRILGGNKQISLGGEIKGSSPGFLLGIIGLGAAIFFITRARK